MFRQMMFSRYSLLATLMVVVGVLLAACGSPSAPAPAVQTTAPAVKAPTQASSANAGTPAAATGAVSFSKDIAPILQNTCISCHGGDKTEKSLDMKTYASLMSGSENGAVIVPGDAANSLLIQKVQSGNMPKRKPKLPADQIQMLVNWVNAGAQNN